MPKNKTNKKKSSKGQQRPKNSAANPAASKVQLSACAIDYALALRDPRDAPLACVPNSYPPLPSYKFRCFSKGTIGCGTSGYGFIAISANRGVINDMNSVFYSGSSYALTTVPATFLEGGVVTATTNSPFTWTELSSKAVQYRLVGAMISVWPVCAEVDLQGEIVALHHPDNESLNGLDTSGMMKYVNAGRFPITSARKPVNLSWYPTKPSDVDYTNTIDVGTSPNMAILFSGKSAVDSWLAYEIYWMFETVGSAAPNKSVSHADPQGFAAVMTAAQSEGESVFESAFRAGKELVQAAARNLRDMSGPAVKAAAKYAVNRAFDYLGHSGVPVAQTVVSIEEVHEESRSRKNGPPSDPTSDPIRTYHLSTGSHSHQVSSTFVGTPSEVAEYAAANGMHIASSEPVQQHSAAADPGHRTDL